MKTNNEQDMYKWVYLLDFYTDQYHVHAQEFLDIAKNKSKKKSTAKCCKTAQTDTPSNNLDSYFNDYSQDGKPEKLQKVNSERKSVEEILQKPEIAKPISKKCEESNDSLSIPETVLSTHNNSVTRSPTRNLLLDDSDSETDSETDSESDYEQENEPYTPNDSHPEATPEYDESDPESPPEYDDSESENESDKYESTCSPHHTRTPIYI